MQVRFLIELNCCGNSASVGVHVVYFAVALVIIGYGAGGGIRRVKDEMRIMTAKRVMSRRDMGNIR